MVRFDLLYIVLAYLLKQRLWPFLAEPSLTFGATLEENPRVIFVIKELLELLFKPNVLLIAIQALLLLGVIYAFFFAVVRFW